MYPLIFFADLCFLSVVVNECRSHEQLIEIN